MYPTTFIAIILAFWSSFHLVHSFLLNNSRFGQSIESFLLNQNLSISYFHVRWFTSRWNRLFIRIARKWNAVLETWFNSGIIFAAFAMVFGTILLIHTLYSTARIIFLRPVKPVPDRQVLSVIVPGVNLPIRDIGYLLPTILISGLLHELGHAVAAAREGVQINGFGMFAFLIYPGAFVDLNSDDMNRKDPICRLRVYCAGVWHNFIICLIICGILLALPTILYPFYMKSDSGVLVIYQTPGSPLDGKRGLQIGDHVIKVDSCEIQNASDWFYCINKTKKTLQWGSCMPLAKIENYSSYTSYASDKELTQVPNSNRKFWMDCCDSHAPQTHLCYKFLPHPGKSTAFACLPGRVMVSSQDDCMVNEDCYTGRYEKNKNLVCAKAHTEPRFKFIRLVVTRANSEKHNVLYVGDPVDIIRSVTVSELLPRISLSPKRFPSIFKRFLQYMFSMSGALALLNIVPCYALDGQWAFKAFLDYCDNGRWIAQHTKDTICSVVLFLGTSLLALNILFGFIHLFTS